MFGEKAPAKVESVLVTETINNVICEGFSVIAHTLTGDWLLTDGEGIQVLKNKEEVISSFGNLFRNAAETDPTIARQDWDDMHLILIHAPKEIEAMEVYLDPIFTGNILRGGNSIMAVYGISVNKQMAEELRALDIHDDVVMAYNSDLQDFENKLQISEAVPLI